MRLIYALPTGEIPSAFKTKEKQLMFVMKKAIDRSYASPIDGGTHARVFPGDTCSLATMSVSASRAVKRPCKVRPKSQKILKKRKVLLLSRFPLS